MSALREQHQDLSDALRTLGFQLLDAVGIVWLAERLGMRLRPWAEREREKMK